ncbi:hypothetical protein J5U22_01998 [Saccharolobus shibatae]|uniref:Uncharacterized protein n=1 Tax=Saccharolobus shibatae TaxID=2286 RepID=A0A8F5C1V1_9CREN|nr:hypothetical protein J5U22_01998 [Saccharolobus shibatae]
MSRLGNEGRRALRELGKKVLKETRDKRVVVDFHGIPQYHKDKSLLSRIKPTKGTSWGLVQAALWAGRTFS